MSPLDILRTRLPFKSSGAKSAFLGLVLYVPEVLLASAVGEWTTLERDYATPILIIAVMFIAIIEPYIGDRIRSSSKKLDSLKVTDRTHLDLIFNNRIRIGVGIVGAVIIISSAPWLRCIMES